ncbi:FKBP-type peptidyl-prolyl cis-trans isomerase, partial [Patulibacter sp.]|uniref:FKBP-type peptidyl-prolyl cis-trans isomerase n=1 Tax=Patulibacter sp. TaxID=1912859 RepID=UPI00271DFAFE
GAAPALAAGCRAPAPRAAGAGSAKAAVKRLVRRAGTDLTKAPKVTSPSGRRPRRLVTDDVVRCGGAKARTGDTVQLRYSLVRWGGSSKVVDSTWKAGTAPASLPLDEKVLVKGFVRGVRGMTPGSRRLVVVPPRLGYGDSDGAGVPPNSTLIFVVDLVRIG